MAPDSSDEASKRHLDFAALLVIASALLPLVALIGWTANMPLLERGGPTGVTRMNPTSALALFSIIGSWFLLNRFGHALAARLWLLFPLLVSLFRLGEYFSGYNTGFDFFLFHDQIMAQPRPNHVASNTAAMLLGLATAVFLSQRGKWANEVASWLVILACTMPFFAIVGYASEFGSLYGANLPTPMALNAAMSGILLGFGILITLGDTYLMRPFASAGSGGLMARRLFPTALGLPILAGLILSSAANRALLDRTLAMAVFIVAVVGIISVVIHLTASRLDEFDEHQAMLARVVQEQNQQLQTIVRELRLNDERLRAAKSIAEEASAAKSNFLARMSHELRTPMNAICGVSDLLWETGLADEQREYVRIFRRNSERLLNLINDILDLSKVEAGALELHAEPFDLGDVMERAAELLAPLAHKKDLEILWDIEPGTATSLIGDADRLLQILVNLLGNAIKFTSVGEVSVRATRDPQKRIDGAILFAVQDTGPGIAAEDQTLIFEAFAQADTSNTRKQGGTGLGLAITRKLTEMMGGRVWVESALEKGSTFFFTIQLPCADSTVEEIPQHADLPKVRALVVDDNETNRMLLCRLLSSWGIECDEAASGTLALEKLARARQAGFEYKVVLLDRVMPEADGFDVAESIQRASVSSPVIGMLTSNYQKGDLSRANSLGISFTLTKPVRAARMHQALQKALSVSEPEPVPVAAATEPAAPKQRTGAKILVAEDAEDNQFLVKAYLTAEPWVLEFVEDGAQALLKALSKTYDLILMDVQMPLLDGYEATRQIRVYEKAKNRTPVPIIALTAHAQASEAGRARDAGCSSYLPKPVTKQALIAEINRWLTESSDGPRGFSSAGLAPEVLALVPQFIKKRRDDVGIIRTHLKNGDFETIRVLAHNMKGTGTSFGLPEITEIGRRMETAALNRQTIDIEALVANLDAVVNKAEGI